jgi:hypothetical protein
MFYVHDVFRDGTHAASLARGRMTHMLITEFTLHDDVIPKRFPIPSFACYSRFKKSPI